MYRQVHPTSTSDQKLNQVNESHLDDVKPFEDIPIKRNKTILNRSPVDEQALDDYLKNHHPTSDDDFYTCSTCCDVDTGLNCCFSSDSQCDLNQYGVGITLYFRFVKQIIIYFTIFSLISIPQLIFSIWSSKDYYSQSLTMNQALMMTTLGSMSMQGDSCMKLSWDDVLANQNVVLSTANSLQKTTLACTTGTISISQFTIGFIDNSSSCTYQEPTDAIMSCTDITQYKSILAQCVGQQKCEFLLTKSLFLTSTECSKYQSNNYSAYVYAFCQGSYLSIGGVTIPNKTLAVICGYIDLLIVILSIIFLFTLQKQEEDTIKNVNSSEIFVSSFSLEFSNLPQLPPTQLYQTLITQLQLNLNAKYPQITQFHIIDIGCAQSNDLILAHEQKNIYIIKRNNMVKKYEIYFNQQAVTSMDLRMNMAVAALNNAVESISSELKNQAKSQIQEIQLLEDQINKLDMEIQQPGLNEDPVEMVWVTFETMEQRNLAYFHYQTDYLRDLFSCCVDLNNIVIDGKILRATPAPQPDDINWQNLPHSTCELLLRRSISICATFILIFATIAAIVFLKQQQLDYQNTYPEINCSLYTNITADQAVTDNNRTTKLGLVECYCKQDLVNRLNEVFSDGQKLCQQWLNEQVKIIGWPFLIVVVIIVINTIIQIIFTKFAEFEAHRSKSKQLSSRLLKVFLVQFINTALVILIINVKFTSELQSQAFSVLLNGKFNDITVQWFSQVGTTILLTMSMYIIAPLVTLTLYFLTRFTKRMLDTCCLEDGRFTRKITQEELNNYYLGPEFSIELRYSTILTIICVNYIYGSGIPALYISTTIYLMLTYWIDKYIMLTYCRIPTKTDDSVAQLVRWILKFLLIWHTIFSIWIYGSTKLFSETENFTQSIQNNSLVTQAQQNVFGEFFQRAVTSQAIGLTVILFLMIAVYIFWPFVVSPILKTFFFFCYSESTLFQTVENTFFSVKQSLYELYSKEQIQKIIALMKHDILKEKTNQSLSSKQFCDLKKERIERLQKVEQSKGVINGICSYDILMNPKYEQFQHL